MMKKLVLLSFFVFSCFLSFTQTDKYTEKLQKLFAEEEYYKVIDYKSDQESEMASISLYFKGIACFQVRNYRRAISYFDNAIQKGDPLADVYYYKGACHLILEEYDESVAELTRAVEMEPGESEYLSLLGRTYFYQEKFDAALVWFEKAVALEKTDAELYARMGDCHIELKQYEQAVASYTKAYENSTKFKDKKYAHYQVAESQYLGGDFDGAKETLNLHLKEFKNDYEAVSLLIQVHYALRETEEAKSLTTKMNEGKEGDLAFPKNLNKMYCIDRFEVPLGDVEVYQAYKDQSYQIYPWRHQFSVFNAAGEVLFTIETQLDSTAGNENSYTICKAVGDTLFKYRNVSYGDNFDYLELRETVQKIISGEVVAIEQVTGYEVWLLQKKKARTGGSGNSFETAIMIESIPAEYAYLRENYPGYTFLMQSLVAKDGVPYDILKIKTADGEELEIYFNISSFFGKY